MTVQKEAIEMEEVKKSLFPQSLELKSVAADLANIKIRFGWLIIIAVLVQSVPFALSAPSSFVELKKTLLVLSYVLLLWALSRNLQSWGMRILLMGTLFNFVAIVANGSLMPVSPEARLWAGKPALGESGFGKVLPEGTGILLPIDQTNLWLLTDIIPINTVHAVLSIGDVLIALGLLIFIVAKAMLPHKIDENQMIT
ncbi:MAG: hypothetical protein DRI01_04740 [Chloroflexi bacterium]|nr:MAG: hypothetical protein DRI01_04740 [Chloroflexota bacterium]